MSLIECRICENCGARNPVNVLECTECSYDLSMVPPVRIDENAADEASSARQSVRSEGWRLVSKSDPSLQIDVNQSIMVGRDEEPLQSYGRTSTFISREHATLTVQDGTLFVTDASTNGTFINGTRLKKLVPSLIHHGDVIAFADMEFNVQ